MQRLEIQMPGTRRRVFYITVDFRPIHRPSNWKDSAGRRWPLARLN
jgi:hypothetical protein